MRGRPGTKALTLADGRAVGGPIGLGVLAWYVALALAGWVAATVALVLAAPDLAGGDPTAARPVFAVHLVAVGLLPFAITGASFHLLPVMLRNDVRHPRRLQVALPLLCGGFLVAPGVAFDRPAILWPGAALVSAGALIVVSALLDLVRGAPRGRTLVASRTGVALVGLHLLAALTLGALVFSHGDASFAGVVHDRWVLVHLHLAVFGWATLLIVTVGRTLAPMLALAPTAPARRMPTSELALSVGPWTLLAGLATGSAAAELAGGGVIVLTLALFARLMAGVARSRRMELEAPLAHVLVGVLFLLQAAVLGAAMVSGLVSVHTGLAAYVVFLLLGWAAGVALGHLGKLLSLSLWVWWPPGPRPKQDSLYPRRLWLVEAATFACGVEVLASGALAASRGVAIVGAGLLVGAALLGVAGAGLTWSRRW